MPRVLGSIAPMWRGVLLTLALLELPRWALVWFGAPLRSIASPMRLAPARSFLEDSSLVVRFALRESAELPMLVTATVEGSEPAYTLHALGAAIRESMLKRDPEVLQQRPGGGHLAKGLAGEHSRVAFRLQDDGFMEILAARHCPPTRRLHHGGSVDGHQTTLHRASVDTRATALVTEEIDRAFTTAARATCRVDQSAQPDEVSRVTSSVSEVRVALGSPQPVVDAFPLHFHRSETDTVLNLRVYSIADTTIARLTPLGIEGVRPGSTTIEGRSWTRDASGVERGGKAALAVPLTVSR